MTNHVGFIDGIAMSEPHSRVDGARVLSNLNALRTIGAYKTGVHKPTFSDAHLRSLDWLVARLPEAELSGAVDGIGNVLGTSVKTGPKLLAGSHLESLHHAGWLDGSLGVVYALEAARVLNPDPAIDGAVEVAAWCDEESFTAFTSGADLSLALSMRPRSTEHRGPTVGRCAKHCRRRA